MRRYSWQAVRFAVSLLALAIVQSAAAKNLDGWVVGVTDGDTITLLVDGRVQHKIRLAGIDAPERGQPFGSRSKELLSSLVFRSEVVVEADKKDRYGRMVGKVLHDGRDVNLAMVASGLAWHYKKYESEQSSSDRLLYAAAEQEARVFSRGLWADRAAIAPWDWRSARRSMSGQSRSMPGSLVDTSR